MSSYREHAAVERRYRIRGFVVATALYVASLFLPAFLDGKTSGWDCLTLVFYAPLFVCLFPAWLANPAFLVGLVALVCGPRRLVLRAGVIAVVLAVSFTASLLPWGFPGPAYFLWLGAIVALVWTGWYLDNPLPPYRRSRSDPPDTSRQSCEEGQRWCGLFVSCAAFMAIILALSPTTCTGTCNGSVGRTGGEYGVAAA